MKFSPPIEAYDGARQRLAASFSPETVGDPKATGGAILKVVDAGVPPLRVFFGSMPLAVVRERYEERLAEWEAWSEVSASAQGSLAA